MNKLFYGDNLEVLREHIADESVDLVYLDPPFNSKRAYNIIFKDKEGKFPPSQIQAFDDTWSWSDDSEEAMWEMSRQPYPPQLFQTLEAFRKALGTTDMMAYLVMMAIRLWELRRVMKDTASIYLHCDPTASHYLKVIMDQVFGLANFRNEIIWQRSNPKSHISVNFPNCTDTILRFTKTDKYTFIQPYMEHDPKYIKSAYKYSDEKGRYRLLPLLNPNDDRPNLTYNFLGVHRVWRWTKERMQKAYEDGLVVQLKPGAVPQYKKYLDDSKGRTVTNCWIDISQAAGNESLGYPTQKPVALLERIVQASSNEGDIVLDPFCGCGTTIAAAEKLNRQWIGIDITPLSINLIEKRLNEHFPDVRYELIGLPKDVEGARKLVSTRKGKFEFENWFVTALGGQPYKSSGGGDSGIDGFMYFRDFEGKPHKVIISVKGGGYQPKDVRELITVVEREKASIGLLLALEKPSSGMLSEALQAKYFEMPGSGRKYQKIQIFTVEEFFDNRRPDIPDTSETLKKAKRITKPQTKPELGI